MSKLKTIEYIFGCPEYTQEEINILQKYFQKDWKFAKTGYIYFIHPELGTAECQSSCVLHDPRIRYQFQHLTVKTIKEYVNRLQKQETNLDRRDQQPTSGIQCTSSKVTIASGHLEDRTIDFRRGSKAKIGKANLSF
jgi:hypothetical protein